MIAESFLLAEVGDLLELDRHIFSLINADAGPWLDQILPWWREKSNWIPLYTLMAFVFVHRFGWRGFALIAITGLWVTVADFTSSSIFKPWVGRLRPCNDPDFADQVRLLLEHCGSGKSFPSSHATNHFALTVFLRQVFGRRWRFYTNLGMLWAAIIAFAQVYVGVHYPFDILVGALLGSIFGVLGASLLGLMRPAWRTDFSGAHPH